MAGYPMGNQSYYGQQQQQQPPSGYQQVQAYGQQQQQQQAPPPSQHYGGYQQPQNIFSQHAWQAMQFNTEAEFEAVFRQHKSQVFDAVQAQELQVILNSTPRIRDYYRINWSLELCKIMIAMLDRSRDGMMQYPEFRELLQCLVYWHQTFSRHDANRSGYMESSELYGCIQNTLNYKISEVTMATILKRYSRAMDDGRLLLAFDDFVSCCVRLRAYTEAFRARDKVTNGGVETGSTTFQYDDFLQVVMCL